MTNIFVSRRVLLRPFSILFCCHVQHNNFRANFRLLSLQVFAGKTLIFSLLFLVNRTFAVPCSLGTLAPTRAVLLRKGRETPDATQHSGGGGSPRRPLVAAGARRGCLGAATLIADPLGARLRPLGKEKKCVVVLWKMRTCILQEIPLRRGFVMGSICENPTGRGKILAEVFPVCVHRAVLPCRSF